MPRHAHPLQPCALDDLMRKLLMVHWLLVAKEGPRQARAAARPDVMAVVGQALYLVTDPRRVWAAPVMAPPGREPPAPLFLQTAAGVTWPARQPGSRARVATPGGQG
jgi:hypothetical protein